MVAVYRMKDSIVRIDRFGLDGADRVSIHQIRYAGTCVSRFCYFIIIILGKMSQKLLFT